LLGLDELKKNNTLVPSALLMIAIVDRASSPSNPIPAPAPTSTNQQFLTTTEEFTSLEKIESD
jgi:hypothetical protein